MITIDSKFINNKLQEGNPKKQTLDIQKINNKSKINTILSSELNAYQVVVIDGEMFNLTDPIQLTVQQKGTLDDSFFHNDKRNIGTKLMNNNSIKKDYNYNGIVTYDGKEYELYSYYYFQFPIKRNILVLNSITVVTEIDFGNEAFGGYRKKHLYHKSKKNKMTKTKLYKKSKKNYSKKVKRIQICG